MGGRNHGAADRAGLILNGGSAAREAAEGVGRLSASHPTGYAALLPFACTKCLIPINILSFLFHAWSDLGKPSLMEFNKEIYDGDPAT